MQGKYCMVLGPEADTQPVQFTDMFCSLCLSGRLPKANLCNACCSIAVGAAFNVVYLDCLMELKTVDGVACDCEALAEVVAYSRRQLYPQSSDIWINPCVSPAKCQDTPCAPWTGSSAHTWPRSAHRARCLHTSFCIYIALDG